MTRFDSGADTERFDLVIDDGLFFDGTGAPPARRSLGIRDGRVAAIRPEPFGPDAAVERVDARGAWVMPGFIDVHTHYDAELEAAPALSESLRHGVTTVVVGSCSLGTVLSSPPDIADMFTRVEAIPRDHVLSLFEARKTWSTPAEYRAHLDTLPLGPNVAALLGHSDLRCSVMGLGRSVTRGLRPTRDERRRMEAIVTDALDAGFLGVSVNTNFWDKLGGDRYRSRPLPGTFASFGEIHALARLVRARGRVLQVIPNISTRYDALFYLVESTRLLGKPLRTSVVSLVDVRSSRMLYRVLAWLARITNRVFGGDLRFQVLPSPFEMYVDGLEAPVFEEIGAGTAALHLQEMARRRELLRDPAYRAWFRRQWTSILAPRVYHRDFRCSRIIACPDTSLVGRSFADVARERRADVVDVFLDLCAEYGEHLRWFTILGNDRPDHLRRMLSLPDVIVGFSDAGAHLRNMAFYNFPLFLLRMARDAAAQGLPFMAIERAVHRLTGEIAGWMGIDAGTLAVGGRADVAVIDPAHLDTIDAMHEVPMPEFGGVVRMVRRNDDAVPAVVVGGRLCAVRGVLRPGVGTEARFGRFLGAGERTPPRAASPGGLDAVRRPLLGATPSPVTPPGREGVELVA